MYKQDFPLLSKGKTIYLDTAASAQKPACVLDKMDDFYKTCYANVHRGQCDIALKSTCMYENARKTVADFIQAQAKNIVFTKGATESINLVANAYRDILSSDDEVLISISEHHANFVPWQQICLKTGAELKVFNVLPDGRLDLDDFKNKLSSKTKLVCVTHLSNVLGIINPVHEIIHLSHQVGAEVLIDGSQAIAHIPVSMRDLDCEYYVFSGHKIYGPTGIGVLYGKTEALEKLSPYQYGGDMIKNVFLDRTEFADIPSRFEAGTPPFTEAIGLAEALDYVSKIGMENLFNHEKKLSIILYQALKEFKNIEILGDCSDKCGLVSFNFKGIHPADLAFILSKENICARVGHHCAMPLHHFFQKDVSLRVSLGMYNDEIDIDFFIRSLQKTLKILGE